MSPELIAILIGIPVDFEDFRFRISASDWLDKYYQPNLTDFEQQEALAATWEEDYQPLVAQPFRHLIDQAQNLGIELFTKATLGDIEKASTSKDVVVIFSHWKGPEILASDLHEKLDRKTLELQVSNRHEPIAQLIQAQLNKLDSSSKQSIVTRFFSRLRGRNFEPPRNVREILCAAIEELRPEVVDGIDEVIESKQITQARHRDALDDLLTGYIRPGNRLELFDGMHNKEEIESIIAKGFEGVLDLTMCTSTYLADHISAQRKQRIRTVQFPTVQKFDWAINSVALTLEIAVKENVPYQEARRTANQLLTTAAIGLSRDKNLEALNG